MSRPSPQCLVSELTVSAQFLDRERRDHFFDLESTGLRQFVALNYDLLVSGLTGRAFAEAYLELHNLTIQPIGIERIPSKGSLLMVSNHHCGILDGIVLGSLLLALRDDVKVVSVEGFRRCLGDHLISVPISALRGDRQPQTKAVLLKSVGALMEHLKGQGAVIVFPGKGVGHYDRCNNLLFDAPYDSEGTLGLASRTGVPVLPVFIECQFSDEHYQRFDCNASEYYALQWQELCGLQNRDIRVLIGEPLRLNEIPRDHAGAFVHDAVHQLRPRRAQVVMA